MLRRRSDERGISLVLFALALSSMILAVGLVVDLGSWQIEASELQEASDAASLAAVIRLPDGEASARARALEVAADNGFVDGEDGVTVQVDKVDEARVRVTITQAGVAQYFTQLFRDPSTITRSSTAQFVPQVSLGSPRNYLGTGDLLDGVVTGDGVENFWLSVSGPCTRREYGDRIATRTMAIPGGSYSCEAGVAGRLANPEYDPRGYIFGVTVPESATTFPVVVDMFDAPTCAFPNNRAGDENNATFDVDVTTRVGDDLDPFAGSIVSTRRFEGGDDLGDGDCGQGPEEGLCTADGFFAECWEPVVSLWQPGTYYIQVQSVHAGNTVNSRHDDFSFRTRVNGVFTPCTSDVALAGDDTASPLYDPECAQIFGVEHLPVFANVSSDDPVFYLASIGSEHNGKTMNVTLYDAAEGASGIELIDPNGNPATMRWEVLCANGASANGGTCPGEEEPTGGRSGGPTTEVDVGGSGAKTFANNTQDGKYSDRLLRLSVKLPDDIEEAWGDRTWWKIRYNGSFNGDRTTWTVQVGGSAVRLVPNT